MEVNQKLPANNYGCHIKHKKCKNGNEETHPCIHDTFCGILKAQERNWVKPALCLILGSLHEIILSFLRSFCSFLGHFVHS
jgi:hypothetical protein